MNYETLNNLFEYFIEHQIEFVEKFDGKTIIIKGFEVVGVYDDEWEAVQNSLESLEPGSFIVQRVEPGVEAYTVNVASNFELSYIQ